MPQDHARDVIIVDAVRTPIGRGHSEKGAFRDLHPLDLLGQVFTEVLARSGVDAADVDDVIAGCVQQLGEQGWNVARNAWLQEGLPIEVPATTVDRQCASGQQALHFAAAQIAAGLQDVVIAAGVEHMGRIPLSAGVRAQDEFGHAFPPKLQAAADLIEKNNMVGQGRSGEEIARRWELSREDLDAIGLRSQQRATAAQTRGAFAREIVEVTLPGGEVVDADQGIRPDTTLEGLAGLKPAFGEDGRHTAGTSSQISDAACAVMLMSRAKAQELGVRARAQIVDQVVVGSDPMLMLTGPIPATQKLLQRNGMTIDDIDHVEINEAFAAVVGAWERDVQADPERVNPRGGAIALGHPLGATGVRLVTTLLHALEDDDHEHGLVTICAGGGLAPATLIRRV